MTSFSTRKPAIASLDGLRGLACLLVLFGHAGYSHYVPLVVGLASTGVVIFFALSGFLMAYHYYPKEPSISYWASFMGHRLIRIYPPFVIATFGYFLIPMRHPLDSMIPAWVLHHANDHLWTVPVEIKFYLAYPLIIFCSLLLFPSLLFAALLLGGIILYTAVGIDTALVMCFRYYFIFTLGVFAGIIYNQCHLDKIKPVYWELITLVSLAIIYICVINIPQMYPSLRPQPFFWKYAWIHGPAAALAILGLTRSPMTGRLFGNPMLCFIGRISFSLYLVHLFIIRALHHHHIKNTAVLFVTILLIAYLYYLIIERPCINLAKSYVKWFFGKFKNEGPAGNPAK